MVKHNNALPNVHYRKEWDMRVKTWLDQPMRKHRRRMARKDKAAAAFPRPVASLRPVVRGQTVRYNTKVRAGRGFTFAELKAAGLTEARAKQIGIAVDHRRTNKSNESLAANTLRLKEYLSKLTVISAPNAKPRARFGEVAAPAAGVAQLKTIPLALKKAKKPELQFVAITDDMKKARGHAKLRQEWTNARLVGFRHKKAKEAEAKAASAKPAEE